jgi:hypothetical protein
MRIMVDSFAEPYLAEDVPRSFVSFTTRDLSVAKRFGHVS